MPHILGVLCLLLLSQLSDSRSLSSSIGVSVPRVQAVSLNQEQAELAATDSIQSAASNETEQTESGLDKKKKAKKSKAKKKEAGSKAKSSGQKTEGAKSKKASGKKASKKKQSEV